MNDVAPITAAVKPARRDNLLWVAALILVGGMTEVWASWLYIASVSGFPKIGAMTTGWILPVTAEAYWATAVYAWLAAPAGGRSRKFAMRSAAVMFALSLGGQESGHLMAFAHRTAPPVLVVMLLTALPLLAVALIAILVELRQRDRAEAAEAAREAHEVSEIARLTTETAAWKSAWRQVTASAEAGVQAARTEARTELDALTGSLETARTAIGEAERRESEATERAETLARKLAARKPNRARTKTPKAAPNGKPNAAPETEVPGDFDARAEALEIWLENPRITGKDLGAQVGLGERWGQLRKTEFAKSAAGAERSDERS